MGPDDKSEENKQVLHGAFLLFIRISVYLVALVMIIRMLHFVLPDVCCWLTEARLQNLDKFFFSGTLGGLVTLFIKRSFSVKSED